MKKHQIVPNQDIWLETGMDPQFLFGLIGIPVCLIIIPDPVNPNWNGFAGFSLKQADMRYEIPVHIRIQSNCKLNVIFFHAQD